MDTGKDEQILLKFYLGYTVTECNNTGKNGSYFWFKQGS